MDFEEIVKKYKNNTATPEEVIFVEDTVAKARNIGRTRLRGDKHTSFGDKIKNFFTGILVALIVVAIVVGICLARVSFIARDNMVVTKTGAKDRMYQFVDQNFGADCNVSVAKESRRLVVCIPLSRSYYLYEYKITVAGKGAYLVTVDSYSEMMEYTTYNDTSSTSSSNNN